MAEPLTPFGNALAGALGGAFSNAVIYPLDTVKTRIQAGSPGAPSSSSSKGTASSSSNKSALSKDAHKAAAAARTVLSRETGLFSGVLEIAKREGVTSLYKGFGASMVNTFSTQFAYFYWYTVVRTLYTNRVIKAVPSKPGKPIALSTAVELLLGALAGALAQLFTIPVSVIATRQQLSTSSSSSKQKGTITASGTPSAGSASGTTAPPAEKGQLAKLAEAAESAVDEDSFMGVARDIMKQDGITGFWRGLKPSLVLTVNPAITYGVFERVKTIILATSIDGKMTPGKSFLVGALSKTLATVVTFPYILSKIRLQAKNTPYNGAIDVLVRIAKEKGISGWYQGMQAQITKAVLAQALLFYFRDYFEIWTRKLLSAAKKP